MPSKKTPVSTARGPPSPIDLNNPALPEELPEPNPSVGEPTVAEYNELVAAHREVLRSIMELKANADSSHTSLGPQE